MAQQDPGVGETEHAGGAGVVHLLGDHHLGAHDSGIADPAHQADGDVHVEKAGSEHGDDRDHEHEEGKGDDDIDQPHHRHIGKGAVVAGERAHQAADGQCRQHREKPDLQIDGSAVDDAQQHVAAQIVGAEGMGEARRQERGVRDGGPSDRRSRSADRRWQVRSRTGSSSRRRPACAAAGGGRSAALGVRRREAMRRSSDLRAQAGIEDDVDEVGRQVDQHHEDREDEGDGLDRWDSRACRWK